MKDLKYAFFSLIELLKTYPIIIVTQILSVCIGVANVLVAPLAVQSIIEAFENGQGFSSVLSTIIMILIIMAVCHLFSVIIGIIDNYVSRNFQAKFAIKLYKKLDSIDYDFHENNSFLNNYNRALEMGPANVYETAVGQFTLIKNIIQSISLFAVISMLDLSTIIYAIAVLIIYITIQRFVNKIRFKNRTEDRPYERRRWYINRTFFVKDSMADLKTTSIEKVLLDNNDMLADKVYGNWNKYQKKAAILSYFGTVLIFSIYPTIIGIVVYATAKAFVPDAEFAIASFAALTTAATSLSGLIQDMASVTMHMQETMTECRISFEVLSMQSTIEGKTLYDVAEFRSLQFENVSFRYTEKNVLEDINFYVKKGEKIAVIGSNGAGKTTLVKLLLRLYDVNEGVITYNDKPYTQITPDCLRKRVGAVFQNPEVYGVTIAENVLLRKVETKADEDLVEEALKFSDLWDYVSKLEEGIHTPVTREFHFRGTIFSGGQTQKLSIARGYAQNYELFILDEPSSALDPLSETALYKKMLELGRDKTIIFVSHRMSTTVNADRVYLFENGKIIEHGTHNELIQNPQSKYCAMFMSQSKKYLGGDLDD